LWGHFYFSGVTFFTLGYGDVTPHTPLLKVLAVTEAGTGFGLIAIVIGYLPVLYQLFSRRETHVIQLDARAGSPPTAGMLLGRHGADADLEELYRLLREWEQWSAELVESHLSYPMLSYYRSQHDNESWLAGLTAVIDSCALVLTGLKGVRTFQARMTFALARLALTELTRMFHVSPHALAPNRLAAPAFEQLREELAGAGLQFCEEPTAQGKLAEFRATYEPFLHGLSEYFLLPLPPWRPRGEDIDNWQNDAQGQKAKELVEEVAAQSE
jgi:hypothetical protein